MQGRKPRSPVKTPRRQPKKKPRFAGHHSPVAPTTVAGRDLWERGRGGGEPGPPDEHKGGEAGPRPQDTAQDGARPQGRK